MPRFRVLILLLGDICLLAGSFFVSAWFWLDGGFNPDLDLELYLASDLAFAKIAFAVFSLLFGIYFVNLYDDIRVRSRRELGESLLLVFGVAFLLQALTAYSSTPLLFSRPIMLLGSSLGFVLILLWRIGYSSLLTHFIGKQRILFAGDHQINRLLSKHITQYPEKGFVSSGCIVTSPAPSEAFPKGGFVEITPDFLEQITLLKPDRICVAGDFDPASPLVDKLLICSMAGYNVENATILYETVFQSVALESITMDQLVFSPAFRPPAYMTVFQELYGRIASILGITLTWPLMLLTALAVRLDSEGPALLRQKRIGQNGKVFEILKFRSMYVDADARFGRTRASDRDPRITRVGRWIRITRLDELPQFFNVLRGDMNFVGPRPEMPIYVEELSRQIPLYPQRHRVKPGITGWAQLFHEPEIDIEQTRRKLGFDLYYIKKMSPLLDFMIMFHTTKAVLFRTGAR